jgi:hypothetical protein
MELAADAANTIAMTDDEKKRIEDLLVDLDVIPELDIPEESTVRKYIHRQAGFQNAEFYLQSSNPYQIVLSAGEGFRPAAEELKRLDAIDDRLRALLPPDDFNSICSTPSSAAPSEQVSRIKTLFTQFWFCLICRRNQNAEKQSCCFINGLNS